MLRKMPMLNPDFTNLMQFANPTADSKTAFPGVAPLPEQPTSQEGDGRREKTCIRYRLGVSIARQFESTGEKRA